MRGGHPWIYRADVVDVDAEGGDIVQVIGPRNRTIGHALFSDQSQIAIRMLTRGDAEADLPLLHSRLDAAIAVREALQLDATAYRLVHAEADLLPSLVVDRYDRYLVVQTLSQGMDRLLPELTAMLVQIAAPAGILARNDPKVRALEGLEQTVEVLHGDVPESIVAREGPVEYEVDLRKGQKTGLFLDQRENREAAARYARGRLLDCFSYNGGFALRLARQCPRGGSDRHFGGRRQPHPRERRSATACRTSRRAKPTSSTSCDGSNGRARATTPSCSTRRRSPRTRRRSPTRSPATRRSTSARCGCSRQAATSITCSCSYNVNEEMFGAVLQEASADSHTPVAIVEKRMQGRDHPVLVGVPETLLPEVLHPAESGVTSSKEAEKTYLGLTGSSAWERAKPFSHPGADTLADSAQLLHDFAVAMMALQPAPDDLILDLGAGGCWVSDLLGRLHRRSVAVDISLEMLQAGRARPGGTGIRAVTGDMEALPFRSGTFHKAVCLSAVHHVPEHPRGDPRGRARADEGWRRAVFGTRRRPRQCRGLDSQRCVTSASWSRTS